MRARPIPASLLALTVSVAACAGLTPLEASLFEGGNALACTGLSLLLPAMAAACPGEEALVNGAVEHARLPAADAGPAAPAGAARISVAAAAVTGGSGGPAAPVTLGAPLFHTRAGKRRHVGCLPAGYTAAEVKRGQAWADGQP